MQKVFAGGWRIGIRKLSRFEGLAHVEVVYQDACISGRDFYGIQLFARSSEERLGQNPAWAQREPCGPPENTKAQIPIRPEETVVFQDVRARLDLKEGEAISPNKL